MKTCPNCGLANDDAAAECETCHAALPSREDDVVEASPGYVMSPQETRFWERMTLRQLAVLIARLQALWLLFYAALDVIYLARYLSRWPGPSYYSSLTASMKT